MQDKFEYREAFHEAFGDHPTTFGVAAAKAKLDKCEERFIVAKSRQDAAYNRFTATVESKKKTVATYAKASSAQPASTDANKLKGEGRDNKYLKRKLKEPQGVERPRG